MNRRPSYDTALRNAADTFGSHMSQQLVDNMLVIHQKDPVDRCYECGHEWPCHTLRMLGRVLFHFTA